MLFTRQGTLNMRNRKWEDDFSPLDPMGTADVDRRYSKAYVRHLFRAGEILAPDRGTVHNLVFYLDLMREARGLPTEPSALGRTPSCPCSPSVSTD